MSTKTASILTRTEPETKQAADLIFERIGTSTSGAINIFLHKAVEAGGFPFEVKISKPEIPDFDVINEDDAAEMLDKSYKDYEKRGGKPAKDVVERLNREYGFASA